MSKLYTFLLINSVIFAKSEHIKNVLIWNPFFEFPDWKRDLWFPIFKSECPVNNCHFTSDRNYLKSTGDFDAVLFHSFNLPWLTNDLPDPGTRVDRQIYVFFSHESPVMDSQDLDNYNGYFNYTMTYRRDSDFYLPFGYTRTLNQSSKAIDDETLPPPRSWDHPAPIHTSIQLIRQLNEDSMHKLVKRSTQGLVGWIVSNCDTPSDRRDYVRKLQEYIDVDIYGRCNNNPCDKKNYDDVMKQYKFYLALENSDCLDYITEKFWNALANHVIPIVQGEGDHAKVAPPGSYIDLKDFPTPSALAEYLLLLDQNSTLYNQYLWWTEYYKIDNSYPNMFANAMCNLCTKLDKDEYKVYTNIGEWWEYNKCTIPVHNVDWFHLFPPFTTLNVRPRTIILFRLLRNYYVQTYEPYLCTAALLISIYLAKRKISHFCRRMLKRFSGRKNV